MDKGTAVMMARKYLTMVMKKYKVKNAYLYGSVAKGLHHAESDIDLAIVLSTNSDIIDVQIDLMQLRTDDDLLIEPHPFRDVDFHPANPFVAEIVRNGIEINFRSSQSTVSTL